MTQPDKLMREDAFKATIGCLASNRLLNEKVILDESLVSIIIMAYETYPSKHIVVGEK